jgi:hypothetical protein
LLYSPMRFSFVKRFGVAWLAVEQRASANLLNGQMPPCCNA